MKCEWFALCENEATGERDHPILGKVPICDRCREKIERIGMDAIILKVAHIPT